MQVRNNEWIVVAGVIVWVVFVISLLAGFGMLFSESTLGIGFGLILGSLVNLAFGNAAVAVAKRVWQWHDLKIREHEYKRKKMLEKRKQQKG